MESTPKAESIDVTEQSSETLIRRARAEAGLASRGYKLLISTTSRLVGEYRGGKVNLSLAFPDRNSVGLRVSESPMSRSAVMVLFEWELTKTPEREFPDLSAEAVGHCVCGVLSALYGKRFDCHGPIEGAGIFYVPDLTTYSQASRPGQPFNSHAARTSFPVKLELSEAKSVEKWLFPSLNDARTRQIQTACEFYSRALQNAEQDAEVAYLHLITGGEVLAGLDEFSPEELLSQDALDDLAAIRKKLGEPCANRVAGSMKSVRKKFAQSLFRKLDEDFYGAGETDAANMFYFEAHGMVGLEDKCFDMKKCLESAYDVRSRYVHSGTPFGSWVAPNLGTSLSDRVMDRPILPDKKLAKILEMCPTFCGLERVVRHALLKSMGVMPPQQGTCAPDSA